MPDLFRRPLTIDPRTGSGDLLPILSMFGIPLQSGYLEFGDAQVIGRGPDERPVLVGVEVKKIGDLLQCIKDHRFVGYQLPGLLRSYEIVYFLVEGVVTSGSRRELLGLSKRLRWETLQDRVGAYEGLVHFLMTQENKAKADPEAGLLRVVYTSDRRGTAAWLATLWSWWNEKAWEDHTSHRGLYLKPLELSPLEEEISGEEHLRKMRVAAALAHGVGVERAREIATHFASVAIMVSSSEDEWRKIPGIGKKLAAQIVANVKEESK